MFQFRNKEAAVQAARLLAAREAEPVLVMVRVNAQVFSIGLRTSAALLEAGRPVATVYSSGQVEYGARVRAGSDEYLLGTSVISPRSNCRYC
jgi:hypothetical protein